MPAPQSAASHARWDPRFHFFAAPILLINVIVTIVIAVRGGAEHALLHWWFVLVAVALAVTLTIARLYALGNQDRIIMLEERLRYAMLLTPELAALGFARLSKRQIIALRFASDEELPSLLERSVRESMEPKAIKQAIVSWRADYNRV